MELSLVSYLSVNTFKYNEAINLVSEKLSNYFRSVQFNNFISSVIVGVNLDEFYYNSSNERYVDIKFVRKGKKLTFTICNINLYGGEDIERVLLREVRDGLIYVIQKLHISFPIDQLIDQFEIFNQKYNDVLVEEKIFVYQESELIKDKSYLPISKDRFWDLIDSFLNYNIDQRISKLKEALVNLSDNFVFGFELTLRDILHELENNAFLIASKNYLNSVTDDSFLYFRCFIVLSGKKIYASVLEKEFSVLDEIDARSNYSLGEKLLHVSEDVLFDKYNSRILPDSPIEYANKVKGKL